MASKKKWYQYVGVQAALILASGAIIVAILNICQSRSQLSQDNQQYEKDFAELKDDLKSKNAEIQRLETLLTPFRTIALERYTAPEAEALSKLAEQINQLQSNDELKSQRIRELESQLRITAEKAAPPTLSLYSKNVESKARGLICTVHFTSSKNTSLGAIQFIVNLPTNSEAIIKNIWPSTKGGAFETGSDSKLISDDGKSARLIYHLMSAVHPVIEITLSGPSMVSISGNYLPNPEIIEVR